MKKYFTLVVLALGMILSGCSREEEELFDQSSAQRANDAIKSYTEILCGQQNGWLMEYFPEASQSYGGYNVILSFSNDGSVKVASEIAYSDDIAESFYQIKQSAGIVLSFDTYNWIFHAYSDPAAPLYGSKGFGMEGDYDFQIVSAEADKVVLKGKKSGGYAVLTPMQGDWISYIDALGEADAAMSFSKYECEFGGYSYSISPSYRTLNFTYVDADEVSKTITAPYIVTPSGFKFYEPVDFNGTEVSELVFDAANTQFSAKENPSMIIVPVIPPINELLVTGNWFITYSNIGAYGKPYFDYAESKLLASEGEHLLYAFLGQGSFISSSYSDDWGFTFMVDTGYAGQLTMDTELIGENQVAMQFAMAGQGNGVYYHNNCSFNYILNVFGYSAPRVFTITADNIVAPSYLILTEEGNPSNVIKLVGDVVTYK